MRARANETASGLTVDVFRCRVRDAILPRPDTRCSKRRAIFSCPYGDKRPGAALRIMPSRYRFSSVLSSDLVSKRVTGRRRNVGSLDPSEVPPG